MDPRHSERADVDITIVGAGPAGAAAAITLAPRHHVLLVHHPSKAPKPSGETLPGAGRRLLTDLGLWEQFLAGPHTPCHARRSRWGGPQPQELDALRDPDGPAWRIDRPHLNELLLERARQRGAHVVTGKAHATQNGSRPWQVNIRGPKPQTVKSTLVIDAAGRGSRAVEHINAIRSVQDRLLCAWTELRLRRPAPAITYVESAPEGWWYTTPLADDKRLLAFYTDPQPDLIGSLAAGLKTAALRSPSLTAQLADCDLDTDRPVQFCAAGSNRLQPPAGSTWLALGDAAMAFDPLSSQGLFHALYSGLTCPTSIERMLAGQPDTATQIESLTRPIWAAYQTGAANYYLMERRWPDQPFWDARHTGAP